jgi:hypothetical protein
VIADVEEAVKVHGALLRARDVWVELVVGSEADREISRIGDVMR